MPSHRSRSIRPPAPPAAPGPASAPVSSLGATAALTFTVLPGTASAAPDAGSPQQAAQLVADASHQLEVVTEQVNTAQVAAGPAAGRRRQADQAAAAAQTQARRACDGQIRQLARSAYTDRRRHAALDVLLTSTSADDFVSQLGTLDAIAGHTRPPSSTEVAARRRRRRRRPAPTARPPRPQAQQTLDEITAAAEGRCRRKIADYQRQYAALTAPQQQQVACSRRRAALAAAARPVAAAAAAAAERCRAGGGRHRAGPGRQALRLGCRRSGRLRLLGPHAVRLRGGRRRAAALQQRAVRRWARPVSRDQLQPGDLVFFYSPVSHVGMYIGNGQMVHASTVGHAGQGRQPGLDARLQQRPPHRRLSAHRARRGPVTPARGHRPSPSSGRRQVGAA